MREAKTSSYPKKNVLYNATTYVDVKLPLVLLKSIVLVVKGILCSSTCFSSWVEAFASYSYLGEQKKYISI